MENYISTVQSPIRPIDVLTPPLDMSTVETNTVYESLLDTNSSCNSSFEKVSTRSHPSSFDTLLDQKWGKLEVQRKLINLQLQHLSKSVNTCSLLSPSRNMVNGRRHSLPSLPSNYFELDDKLSRKSYSAPASPIKKSLGSESSNSSSDSSVNPPSSFTYDSIMATPIFPTSQEGKDPSESATQQILEFLAHKVD